MKETANRIRAFRLARGWSFQRLADACQTSKSQIDKLEKGERRLTADWMVRLAKPLGCDPRELILAPTSTDGIAPSLTLSGAAHDNPLPVFSLTLNADGIPVMSDKPMDQTARPAFLLHAQGAYALYVADDTMVPMYRPRQTLFVHPRKLPSPGNGVLVVMKDQSILLRAFIAQTVKEIELRAYGKVPQTHGVSLKDVAELHAIVGTIDPL